MFFFQKGIWVRRKIKNMRVEGGMMYSKREDQVPKSSEENNPLGKVHAVIDKPIS